MAIEVIHHPGDLVGFGEVRFDPPPVFQRGIIQQQVGHAVAFVLGIVTGPDSPVECTRPAPAPSRTRMQRPVSRLQTFSPLFLT